MGKKVILTGGSGAVGRVVVKQLLRYGHTILNLDRVSLDEPKVHTTKCDLTNAGHVYSAMVTPFRLSEPLEAGPPSPPDAVIHFAAIPRPMLAPDIDVFSCNVASTYNVVEAACKLGVRKIIIASSVTTYGVTYADGQKDFAAFPVDEDSDCNPTDTYALSKLVAERVARSFATRFNVDIYCLRIGAVIGPDDYGRLFPSYVTEPEKWAVHGWSYTDARDLGQMCHLALGKDGLGYQVFNATNDSITNNHNTTDFLKANYPHIPHTRPMGQHEAPMSNRKVKEMLGFEEEHPWQKYFKQT
jgi:nucleoside-diphosphate-sugar epimerase